MASQETLFLNLKSINHNNVAPVKTASPALSGEDATLHRGSELNFILN
jgi:hypothetical protein